MTVWAPCSQANMVLLEITKSGVLRTAGLLWALNLMALLINNIKLFGGKKLNLCAGATCSKARNSGASVVASTLSSLCLEVLRGEAVRRVPLIAQCGIAIFMSQSMNRDLLHMVELRLEPSFS